MEALETHFRGPVSSEKRENLSSLLASTVLSVWSL